jgi:hypothetical protein
MDCGAFPLLCYLVVLHFVIPQKGYAALGAIRSSNLTTLKRSWRVVDFACVLASGVGFDSLLRVFTIKDATLGAETRQPCVISSTMANSEASQQRDVWLKKERPKAAMLAALHRCLPSEARLRSDNISPRIP